MESDGRVAREDSLLSSSFLAALVHFDDSEDQGEEGKEDSVSSSDDSGTDTESDLDLDSEGGENGSDEQESSSSGGSRTIFGRASLILGIGLWLNSIVLAVLVLLLSWTPDSRMELIRWIPGWLSAWADSGGQVQTMRTGLPLALAGFLFALSWGVSGIRLWLLWGVVSALVLVVVAEGGQHFLPSRTADWRDVWWGAAGALAGVVIAAVVSGIGRGLAKMARGRGERKE